jgi:hypothetical protein
MRRRRRRRRGHTHIYIWKMHIKSTVKDGEWKNRLLWKFKMTNPKSVGAKKKKNLWIYTAVPTH